MVVDKISNLINSLKTGGTAGKESIRVPSSHLTEAILAVLKKEEFISDFSIVGDKKIKEAVVTLKYTNGDPAISGARRVSKTARRIYRGADKIKSVKSGYGLSVVTTPKGVMASNAARKEGVGGEVLFEIW